MGDARVVFMGTPEYAVPALARLAQEHEVVAVYTQPDRPAGRGRALSISPVKAFALAHGIPVVQPETLRRPEAVEELATFQPDVVVVAAFGMILPSPVLRMPPHGCLNIHASLLPRWRGASPIAAAILAGDSETGCSIMLMGEGIDTGPVLARRALPIAPEDTAGTLSEKLAHLGADLLAETLPRWLAGEVEPQAQDEERTTYAPLVRKAQGQLDWTRPAVELARQVRAYNPWPGAYTFWGGQLLKVVAARPVITTEVTPPGQVIPWEDGAAVGTGEGLLVLKEVQLTGRRPTPIDSFVRGARGFLGSRLAALSAAHPG